MGRKIIGATVGTPLNPDKVKEMLGSDEEWLNPLREKFSLPEVDTSDVGKFLRVSADGKWAAELLQDVSEVGM